MEKRKFGFQMLNCGIYSYFYNKQASTVKDKCWSRVRCIVCRNQRCLVTRIIHHGRGDTNNFEQKQDCLPSKMNNYPQLEVGVIQATRNLGALGPHQFDKQTH